MRWWFCGLSVLVLVFSSCAGPELGLTVKAFHLREAGEAPSGNEVVRGEHLKRLYGAVSAAERRDRLGDYYTVKWHGPTGREAEPVRIEFDYRQAATGAKVIRMEQERPGSAKGTVEFKVTGEAYQKGGRVLAWRIRLYRAGGLVDTKRSYLWN